MYNVSLLSKITKYIKKMLMLVIIVSMSVFARYRKFNEHVSTYKMTLMISPAGDAHHVGRIIDDWFERGITLQCAEALKKQLEQQYPGLRVILTRTAAEYIQPLQNANFANCMNVDLYLSLHFFHEASPRPRLYIYRFSYGNNFCSKLSVNGFYPYEQAYLFSIDKTEEWANVIKEQLTKREYGCLCESFGPYAIPFKPLIGIKSPAIGIEVSLKSAHDWQIYIEPLIASLDPIIMEYQDREAI